MNVRRINKKLRKSFGGKFTAVLENGCVSVRGESADWDEIVSACLSAAKKNSTVHVLNDIVFTGGQP